MSYGVAPALQSAVYQRLSADPGLGNLVGAAIYDTMPPGPVPKIYVTLGPETARDASDKTGRGATHEFVVSVITSEAGFQAAKDTGQAISDALIDAPLALTRGSLVSLNFLRARAVRFGRGDRRRLDLTFRARVDDS